ncbi:MAG: DUF4129 domain-containing protein [Tannerella sp.]|jgi:hypothetical protein|nr:DUF4129 domain-containing protein [Tannerella sp.]
MKAQADTIIYDTQKIADYQADSRFDYNSQLDLPEYTWFEIVSRWFNRLINSIFRGKFEENITTPVMVILFILALLTILFFLYKKRPELFMRSKKTAPVPYDIEEENIHQINFDKEISLALNKGDYRLAIRLLYLQTLRFLSDNKLIDWQIHKTPTEYLYEIKNKEMKLPFWELTNHFLQVRYGNYKASSELYETMHGIQSDIKNKRKGEAG